MKIFTTLYILLLVYIIAALVFWGISLYKQNEEIYQQGMIHLQTQVDSTLQPEQYHKIKYGLDDMRYRRIKQYVGEGSTFLLIILIGASVVYSSYRRSAKLSRQQNNFMLSVTHELKSPIATMKLNLQTLEKHKLDEEKRNKLMNSCIQEANRLNDLCNNILIASQIEGKQYKTVLEKADGLEIIRDFLKTYSCNYPQRLQIDIEEGKAFIMADKFMLQIAIGNILENALKYTKDEIVAKAGKKKEVLSIQIADYGSGISEEEKSKVFRKFYRIGNEETRHAKGTGLGLFLSNNIIKKHKGRIIIKNNQPRGSIFEIELPMA